MEAASVAALEGLLTDSSCRPNRSFLKGRLVISGIEKALSMPLKDRRHDELHRHPGHLYARGRRHPRRSGYGAGTGYRADRQQERRKPGRSVYCCPLSGILATLIGMVGNLQSILAKQADMVLNTTVSQEACHNNLAPTSSTTAQMVTGRRPGGDADGAAWGLVMSISLRFSSRRYAR